MDGLPHHSLKSNRPVDHVLKPLKLQLIETFPPANLTVSGITAQCGTVDEHIPLRHPLSCILAAVTKDLRGNCRKEGLKTQEMAPWVRTGLESPLLK